MYPLPLSEGLDDLDLDELAHVLHCSSVSNIKQRDFVVSESASNASC